MIVVLDWPATRGRFNFSPDRMGVILETTEHAFCAAIPTRSASGWVVQSIKIAEGSPQHQAIMGYADLPI